MEILGDSSSICPIPDNIQCIEEISSHFPRCTSLSLVIDSPWFLSYFAMLKSFTLSMMESLSTWFSDKLNLGVVDYLFYAFTNASKLIKLQLNVMPLQSKQFHIPFHQLTKFTYRHRHPGMPLTESPPSKCCSG